MDHSLATLVRPAAARGLQPVPRAWQRRYARVLLLADGVAILFGVFATQALWLGLHRTEVTGAPVDYLTLSALLSGAWVAVLALFNTRAPRVIGYGASEYRLVISASLHLFGAVAIANYLFGTEVSRGYFLLSLPLGTALIVGGRILCRSWLRAQRGQGRMTARVLLLGDAPECARVSSELDRQPSSGLQIVGTLSTDPASGQHVKWGEDDAARLRSALAAAQADTVLVAGGASLDAQQIRRIGWSLEPGRQHLVVAVNLTDVAGPRIHTRPVAGLPLVHVETPRYSHRQFLLKRGMDIVGSATILVILAPLLAALGLGVRLSGPGPVLYRQERVGQGGVPFGMLKFRSMIDGADARLGELLAAQGSDGQPLFKVTNDPRITPLGLILRKYSLDELPQLWNVLRGQMSLVGPRPQREAEVAFYDDAARRRLIVRPGMSGLWQVSGRSALTWDDAIRLDLFYVENWSLVGDIVILARTFKAVVMPGESAR
ncbi:sugar transferase [Microbacterium testaceum]|uniref:sugar transferase n=1 Tax=Microbacterium testaceum TaxID=2033 RepID=UPI002AC4DB29|nr:sugar transferase [Microbacterium testaceum]MDZ5146136.1 sugar transferase [Microbacterium testaceum]